MVPRSPPKSPAIPGNPPPSPTVPYADMSYLAGPTVLLNDGLPEVSRTGVDRILPSRPVQGSWQPRVGSYRGPGPLRTLKIHTGRKKHFIIAVGR